ncbi:MAG: tetratricopeptide repeat protein [Candidatus Omnitrophota bacterium]|nr:MAG: tetratricopeptide repeat protein [Candidatus Omnitrophota bacterium]
MKKIIFLVFSFWFLIYSFSAYSYTIRDAYEDYLYGDYHEAIKKAERLRENDEVLYFLGLIYMKVGEHSKVRAHLRKLLRRFPSSQFYEQGLMKLADTYFLERDFPKAKELYWDIVQKYPNMQHLPRVYLRLAQIACKEGDWGLKKMYLRMIKEKYPSCSEMKFVEILQDYGDFFTIQIGAFSKEANALTIKKELQVQYPVYIVEDRKGGIILYKVRVGKFKQRDQAKRVFLQLLEDGYPAIIYP